MLCHPETALVNPTYNMRVMNLYVCHVKCASWLSCQMCFIFLLDWYLHLDESFNVNLFPQNPFHGYYLLVDQFILHTIQYVKIE